MDTFCTFVDIGWRARAIVQLIAGPIDRLQGHGVESIGVEQGRLIVVPKDGRLAMFDHQIKAFAWVWAIANDVTQAVNFIDRDVVDVRQDGLERLEVAVDIANQRSLHGCFLMLAGTIVRP